MKTHSILPHAVLFGGIPVSQTGRKLGVAVGSVSVGFHPQRQPVLFGHNDVVFDVVPVTIGRATWVLADPVPDDDRGFVIYFEAADVVPEHEGHVVLAQDGGNALMAYSENTEVRFKIDGREILMRLGRQHEHPLFIPTTAVSSTSRLESARTSP